MNLLLFNFETDAEHDLFGFTTDWINAFAERFDKVVVVSSRVGKLEVAENVEVHSLGVEDGNGLLRKLWIFCGLMRRILWGRGDGRDFDLVFYHMAYHFAILAWPFLWLDAVRRKVRKMRKASRVLWYAHKSVPLGLKVASRAVDKIVTTSKLGCQLTGKQGRKVQIVGHGVDEQRFAYRSRKGGQGGEGGHGRDFEIMTLARLSPVKRIELVIKAMALLRDGGAGGDAILNVKLKILGDAGLPEQQEYKAGLEALVKELGLEEQVKFEGSVSYAQVSEYLAEADLSVNVSATGSLDKAVLESLSAGVPVLAPREGYACVFERTDDFGGTELGNLDSGKFLLDDVGPEHVAEKIRFWMRLSAEESSELMREVSVHVQKGYGVKALVGKVVGVAGVSS